MSRPALPIFKYHGSTVYLAYADDSDLTDPNFKISAFEDVRTANIMEQQLLGTLRAFRVGGTFIYKDGFLQERHSPTSLIVSTSGLEGFVNSVAFGGLQEEMAWSGLNPGGSNWLWASLVEDSEVTGDFRSSRMKSDWEPLSTPSAVPPANRDSALIATFTSGVGIDDDPAGKAVVIPSLSEHVLRYNNPHGEMLYQNYLVASGMDVLEPVHYEEFNQSGALEPFLIDGNFMEMGTTRLTISGSATVLGTVTYHGNMLLFGANVTDEGAIIAALDHVQYGTIGALTVISGLEVRSLSEFHEDVSLLSGVLWDGLSISGHGAELDFHIQRTDNPHHVVSGQVPDVGITEVGGTLNGNLSMASGVAIDGVDFSTLTQFLDGSVLTHRTHLHDTSSGLQFFGGAPEGTAYEGAGVTYEHRSGKNLCVLSGVDTVVTAHIRKFLPENIGTPIGMSYVYGVNSTLSGTDARFGGRFDVPDLDNILDYMVVAATLDQDAGTVRANDLVNGIPLGWLEYGNVVPTANGIILSGADFESSLTPDPGLQPVGNLKETTSGAYKVSLSVWVKPESSTTGQVVVAEASESGPATPRFRVLLNADNSISVRLQRMSGTVTLTSSSVIITDGVFNHLVVLVDLVLNQYEIWVNNVQKNTGSISGSGHLTKGTPTVSDSVGLWLGAQAPTSMGGAPSSAWDGVIDIPMMWTGLRLSASHIGQLYNSGAGIQFQGKRRGGVTMRIKDSDGDIISPVESRELRGSGVSARNVNLFEGTLTPSSFFEVQFILSGVTTDEVFYGPWALHYAPTNLTYAGELAGLGIGSNGGT